MKDLIEAYFKSDLTEAEDQAMLETLLQSDDAARRFFQLAQSAYGRYGLPEPHWPGETGSAGPSVSSGLGRWIVPVVLVLLGVIAVCGFRQGWFLFERNVLVVTSPAADGTGSISGSASLVRETGAGKGTVEAPARKKDPTATTQAGSPLTDVPAAKAPNDPAVSGAPAGVIEAPPSIDGAEKEKFSELNVVVGMKNPGSVTVVVLDPSGAEVRRLYDGVVQAGRWSFDWDGRLEGNRIAQPGAYRIEVRSGGVTQSKEVKIR